MRSHIKWFAAFMTLALATTGQAEFGLKNFKEVMPGALYRGGGNGEREPMSSSSLKGLCEAGFGKAYYLYGTKGKTDLSCSGNKITYINHSWKSESTILRAVYDAIQTGSGPVYAHCWYGVHASGYVAAVALMQFCGYSANQAVSYWNQHVPKSIQYKKVQDRIRGFKPNPKLNISRSQQAKYCP